MDPIKTGLLIRQFRTERGLTQKQLAAELHVSDKAVSKWERGSGCPDVSLLFSLAEIFGTDIRVLLSGETEKNEKENGNMKKMKFYVCKTCGNIITAASDVAVTCCGTRLTAAEPRKAAEHEQLKIEDLGGEWFITADHEMSKSHYIAFVAYVNDSQAVLFRQYPEWDLQITLPLYRAGRLIWYCTQCGFLYQEIGRKSGRAKPE